MWGAVASQRNPVSPPASASPAWFQTLLSLAVFGPNFKAAGKTASHAAQIQQQQSNSVSVRNENDVAPHSQSADKEHMYFRLPSVRMIAIPHITCAGRHSRLIKHL